MRFYQELRSAGVVYEMTEYPLLGAGVSVPLPVRMHGTQIQYMSANPQVAYGISYSQFSRGYAGGQPVLSARWPATHRGLEH
jgi:hypothetical protein